ncbi:uncharacterized protein [Amphiura filiformis]|uniref:uncharacterized protein n=1 Tax=Amphiura filiformis TaxID=82378 RepID=UPI003B222D8F
MDLGDGAGSRQKSPLGSSTPGLFDANRLFGQAMFTGHPSAGHEHFSAVPHVPSAFSMFGPPGYSLLRPTGTEFGGLGSLHSLTEAARLQALGLPMAGHNPLSPSTGWSFEASAQLFSLASLGDYPQLSCSQVL